MEKKCVYVDNDNNFYLYREIALRSGLKWIFVIFEKEKEKLCSEYGIEYVRIKPVGSKFYGLPYDTIKKAINNDRILKRLPSFLSVSILRRQLKQFNEILQKYSPEIVIGEISWANEYCFYMLCEQVGIRYRHPLNLPVEDSNRVVLFDAEHSYDSLYENYKSKNSVSLNLEDKDSDYAINYYDLCRKLGEYNSKKKVPLLTLAKIFNVANQVREYRHNQMYYKSLYIIRIFYACFDSLIIEGLFGKTLDKINKKSKGKKVVFFPLHIQPESTPDFVNLENSDQFSLIEKCSISLGNEYQIVIKDHPNKVSVRNIFKLLKIIRNKNIIWAKRSVGSVDLIKVSDFTATIAGTAAIESIRNGVPAIVFSNVFYHHSKYIFRCFNGEDLKSVLEGVDSTNVYDDLILSDFGVSGFVHDPFIFPNVLNEENVIALAALIDSFSVNHLTDTAQ